MSSHRLWRAIVVGCFGLLFCVPHPASGQSRDLTLDEILRPPAAGRFRWRSTSGLGVA